MTPPDEQISERLTEIVHPATLAQVAHFHRLGLWERVVNLPVMVALVLSMVWPQIGAVNEPAKMLRTEGLLWAEPRKVSQQALSEQFRTFQPPNDYKEISESVTRLGQANVTSGARILPVYRDCN